MLASPMQAPIQTAHRFAFFLIGFAPLTAQLVLIRELLVVVHGNELFMGIMLGAWLLWTGLGSLVLGRWSDRAVAKQRWLALAQAPMAILLPLSMAGVRASKLLWGIPVGETVDLVRMVAITFTAVAPLCLLSGFLFALGCGLHDQIAGGKGRSIGAIFFLEALGAAVGGLLTAVVFFRFLNHFEAAFVVSLLLLVSAGWLTAGVPGGGGRGLKSALLLLILIFSGFLYAGKAIDRATRQWAWPGQHLIEAVDTPYGNLAAVGMDAQITVFENGLWLFSYPDPQSVEHAVHLALLQHAAPRRVLLVGGGISGALAEVLKHPTIERVDYVELDPEIIRLGRRLMAGPAGRVLDDPRVRVVHQDGRRYVNTVAESYDVIVVDLPDPLTVQLNRFYTVEFFTATRRILAPDGVLAISLSATEYMVGPTLARSLAVVQQTLRQVYAEVVIYPGGTARFFAADRADLLITDPVALVDRVRRRALALQYVQDYYLLFNFSPEKLGFLQNILATVGEQRINRDFTPALYYDVLLHWSAQYTPRLAGLMRRAEQVELAWLLFPGMGLTAALALAGRISTGPSPSHMALYYACFTAGFTEMTLSVLLIMAFQILYGDVYYKIALLLTAFMVGLMIGSHRMSRRLPLTAHPLGRLIGIQSGLAGYGLVLWGVVAVMHQLPAGAWAAPLLEAGFPLLLLGAGILGGLHFPLVSHIYLERGYATGRTAGKMYALDLAGASVGALLCVMVLVPGVGIGRTLVLLAAFNLLAAGWLAADRRVRGPAL